MNVIILFSVIIKFEGSNIREYTHWKNQDKYYINFV